MKLRIERDVLVDQLVLASRGVNARGGGLFVLTGLHLRADADGLTVTGTDLDLTVRSQLRTAAADGHREVAAIGRRQPAGP